MRIVLVNPYAKGARGVNDATVYPPCGLAYLASYLRNEGLEAVRIIDANVLRIENEELMETLGKDDPDIVGVHLNVILGASGVELCRLIKKSLRARLFIGGPLASSNPVETLTLSGADAAVIGEGEVRFAALCKGADPRTLPGTATWQGGRVLVTPAAAEPVEIDRLPFPAYDLLPPPGVYRARARRKPVGVMLTSRGCPCRCTFCNGSVFGKRIRMRSPENVLQELDGLVRQFGIRQLDILDDNFTWDVDRAERIFDGIIARDYPLLINLQNGIRADRLSDRLIRKMRMAGVFKVGIGVESADEATLRRIRKRLSLEKVRDAIGRFRAEGIMTYAFFMIGFPDDTPESIEKTIDFAMACNPTVASFALLLPLPGTEIHRQMTAAGQLVDPDRLFYEAGFFGSDIPYRLPNLSEAQLRSYANLAYRRFNFRPTKVAELLGSIRSFGELTWTAQAALPLVKRMIA